jgi:hypothetical protein
MSNSGAWGPAPDGVDLNEDQNASIISSVTAIMIIGLLAVGLRLYARLGKTGPGLGIDDHAILVATVLGIGTAVCCLISVPWGGGKHLWVVSIDEFTKLYQTTFAFVVIYITCVCTTKTSILLFYRRVFGTSIAWWVVCGLNFLHWLEVTVVFTAGCQPASYYWRQYTEPGAEGHCIDDSLLYFINGIIGMLIDISVLLVPIPSSESLSSRVLQVNITSRD